VSTQGDDPAATTVTLPDDAAASERRFYARLGGLLLIAALGYLVWLIVEPLWQPLLWAVLLGALLAPANERLTQRLGGRTRLATSITLLVSVLLVLLPLAVIMGAVGVQAAHLVKKLEAYVPTAAATTSFDFTAIPMVGEAIAWVQAKSGLSVVQLQEWLVQGLRRLLEVLMRSGGTMVMGALGTLVSVLLMVFVLFFVLRDGPGLARQVVPMLTIEERRRTRLWQHLADVTRAVFLGIGLTALVQGLLVGIGFWIAGLPSPLVFGVAGVIAALIPMVGAALVWVPGALYLAFGGDYGHAIFLVAWGAIVISMVDNFLRPMLISGRSEVPTLAVFVGVMGGLAAFGFVGLFIGPIVLGLLVALFRYESEVLEANPPR